MSITDNTSYARIFAEETKGREVLFSNLYDLAKDGKIIVGVTKHANSYQIVFVAEMQGLILHWGIAEKVRYEWKLPQELIRPYGSVVFENSAVQTPFVSDKGFSVLKLEIRDEEAPLGIQFVFKQAETSRWLKDNGKNFYIPVSELSKEKLHGAESVIAEEIISGETGRHSWTLMHRFNLCHDLLDKVRDSAEGLAFLFVWLRFSAIRQLDWQRNYNTKPRELSHAMDRLTLKIADAYKNCGSETPKNLLRLMLTTLGRGGEGQKIRDEILNIMHKHHIKEVAGHFMEQWHQKLHNNTTPDDIVICEAYLNFLMSEGNLSVFYSTLESGGVTRDRLRSFERPITVDPDFIPFLKDGLIHDFRNYLGILKSVHSGSDLEIAVHSSRYIVDPETGSLLDFILRHKNDSGMSAETLVSKICGARDKVRAFLERERESRRIRDLLFLDIALIDSLRIVVERNIHLHLPAGQMTNLTGMIMWNLLSEERAEMRECLNQWEAIKGGAGAEWALEAKSVIDRLMRIMGEYIDSYYSLLQPKAEFLGKAFGADSWTINIFSEEVIRGSLEFVLSMLLRHIEPALRKEANLGNWQVISPGSGGGWVEVADVLRSVQGIRFDKPTVIIADKVMGDEEPPDGVTAIITKDVPDIVSHVAVRARNKQLLFATCYDNQIFDYLKSRRGSWLNLRPDVSGDVVLEETGEKKDIRQSRIICSQIPMPVFFSYAVSSADFTESIVGRKANNIARLRTITPEWIHIPSSAALPFGVFEKILLEDRNKGILSQYDELVSQLSNGEKDGYEQKLMRIRDAILRLELPDELISDLEGVMRDEGISLPKIWHKRLDDVKLCIKKVWASKWNERAYLSRRAMGISDKDLFMAVLVQEVVEADYAFVIHTVNPLTGESNKLFAEVVLGLGETLVGNYPGRAFGFVSDKVSGDSHVISYPSKSIGLYGSSIIFRSDSNGEDLAGYAGAGLYDSVILDEPKEVLLNYSDEPLIRDKAFKKNMIDAVKDIGVELESLLNCPQDIEGAYSKGRYYVVQTRPQVGI